MATFKTYQDKDGNMQWGVLLADNETGSNGKKIDVIKRNGKTKTVTLDNPVFGSIWSIVGGSKPKHGRYIPRDGKCKDCGAAIPSKYLLCPTCKAKITPPGEKDLQCPHCNSRVIGPDCITGECAAVSAQSDPFPEW